ncbi:zinc finger protein RFP-like [Terrapene carolina triunguis]|uniref:Zinc finger protein RFP-like n=1 Tax=Terrapene triunguis TaxID=2587831 RepID=A0A674IPQ2_9SAUR|nr:zinc finger protein RFP-like [Terrapene carolina triunguis]
MASSLSGLDMQEEVICPICLEYLTDPVSVDCGHNFCRGCVTQYCAEWAGRGSLMCPVCRSQILKGNLRPNWQLGNLVEKMKHVAVCARHKKTLDLFCEEDREAVCVVCERSLQHRSHTVLLIEEAGQKYKEKIQDHLKTLTEEREKLLGFKVTGEGKSREYLKQTQTERQKIVSEFQQLRQFLEEQERLLLAQLEKLDEEIVRIQNENVTKLSEEISHLSELICEMEGKCQKPASEFLQDVRSTLSRCEKWKFQQPVETSPDLEKRLSVLSHKNVALMETLRQFKDTLPSELESKGWKCLGSQREDTLPSELEQGRGKYLGSHANVHMTLDPDTAHPQLVLSEDRKTVRYGRLWNKLPNTTKRFDYERCVLGSEGFTSGRHCWEVEAGERGGWAMGVARESLGRKGEISFNPEGGIWAMEYWEGQYWALTDPLTPLPLSQVPRRIWVYLDYKQGQVAFFNADNESLIFTFPPASFAGERIRPFFVVWETESQLRLCA